MYVQPSSYASMNDQIKVDECFIVSLPKARETSQI